MAALGWRNPNLDDFVGLKWSCWVDGVNIFPSDAGSNTEDSRKYGRTRCETMTLMKEDMHIYGHCPAHDEIYLVVCSQCGQVVKPQAFEKHCERRHGLLTKTCDPSPALASQQQRRPGHPSADLSITRENQKDGKSHGVSAASSTVIPVYRHKPAKDTVSSSSAEKVPQEIPPLPPPNLHSSSAPSPRVSLLHSGPLPPGHCSSISPPERLSKQRPTAGQSSQTQSPQRGMRIYSRLNQNSHEEEFDLDKHSESADPKRKKLYSQELICKQKKTLEHPRASSTGQNMDMLSIETRERLQRVKDKTTTQGSRYSLNSSCHIFSRSRGPSESFQRKEGDGRVEVEVQPPYPFNQTLLSSDEDENDDQEDVADLPATPWHPKPLGLCTFGCRTLGCSIFTFDRRWHHLQFALSAMLERHVSTHRWKKMPQVSASLRSHPHTPLNVGSPLRTGARLPKSSTSQATKNSENYSNRTKQPSTTAPVTLSPGQPCSSPVGRHSKAQLRGVEPMQEANSESKSSKYIRSHKFCQPLIPSSEGPVNGSFSYGKKPCPALHQSPSSRGRPPGIQQQQVTDCNRTGPTQKRKGKNESKPLSSSISRASKCQRLSSSPCSNLLAWKGENKRDVLAWGRERRSDS